MDYEYIDNIRIGKFIFKCRMEKQMTQKELADKLNVTSSAISKWEKGKGCPDISLLLELSRELDVSIDELLNGARFDNSKNVNNDKISVDGMKFCTDKEKNKLGLIISIFVTFSLVALIIPFMIIISNWTLIFYIVAGLFIISLVLSKIFTDKYFIKYLWSFWLILYIALFVLSIVTTKLVNFYLDSYWGESINLIPFKTIIFEFQLYFKGIQEFNFVNYYVLNKVYITIPFPIILSYLRKDIKFLQAFMSVLLVIIFKEIFQSVFGVGVFDIDDVILNMMGFIIGYIITFILKKINWINKKEGRNL